METIEHQTRFRAIPALEVIMGKREGDLALAVRELDQLSPMVQDAHFRHYLVKRSYAKAYAYLTEGAVSGHGEGASAH